MARKFTAASSEMITTAPGDFGTAIGAFSYAFVLRVTDLSGTRQIFRTAAGATGVVSALVTTSGTVTVFTSSSTSSTSAASLTVNKWYVVAGSKAAGVGLIRHALFDYSTGTWTHQSPTSAADAGTTPTSITIGRHATSTAQAWDGDIVVGALWRRALGVADFERLPYSLQAWMAAAPSAAWLLDQQSVAQPLLDWTGGGANQTAITGTAVSAESVPWFSYGHPIIVASRTAGDAPPSGSGSLILPRLTASASGTAAASGASALTLPALQAAGTGTVAGTASGSGALTFPALIAAATGAPLSFGAASLPLPALTAAATGVPLSFGAASLSLPTLTGAGAGTASVSGAAALALPRFSASGTGTAATLLTSSPNAPLTTISRDQALVTISRDNWLTTGTQPRGGS